MGNKIINILSNCGKLLVLLAIFYAGFAGYGEGSVKIAQAQSGCTYGIKSFAADQQTYSVTGTVKFRTALQLGGNISSCKSKVIFKYKVQVYELKTVEGNSYYDKSKLVFKDIGEDAVPVSGAVVESKNFQYSLSKLDFKGEVPDPTKVVFAVDVTDDGWVWDSSLLSSQDNTRLSISTSGSTGGPGSTGEYNLNLELHPSVPSAGYYKYPDVKKLTVSFYMDSWSASQVKWDVQVQPFINNKPYGSPWPVSKTQLTVKKSQDIEFAPASGFKDGPNEIIIQMSAKGSPEVKVASGRINFQAQGMASSSVQPGAQPGSQPGAQPGNVQPGAQPGGPSGENIDCTQLPKTDPRYAANCLYNPLPKDALTDMLLVIMKGFLAIIAIWAVTFIVIGGFRMVMAQGNEEAYTTAKKTITWAVLGLVIALLSFAIVAMVQNFLQVEVLKPTLDQTNGQKK